MQTWKQLSLSAATLALVGGTVFSGVAAAQSAAPVEREID